MRLINEPTPGIEQKQWNVYTAASNPIVGVWAKYPEHAMALAVKHAVLSGWETPTVHVTCQDVTGDDWSWLTVADDPRPAFVLESLLELHVPPTVYARVSKALNS